MNPKSLDPKSLDPKGHSDFSVDPRAQREIGSGSYP